MSQRRIAYSAGSSSKASESLPGANLVLRGLKGRPSTSLQRAKPMTRTNGNLFEPSRGNAINGGSRSTEEISPVAVAVGVGSAALGAFALAGAWAIRQRRAA